MKLAELTVLKEMKKKRKGLVRRGFYAFNHNGRVRPFPVLGNMDIRESLEIEFNRICEWQEQQDALQALTEKVNDDYDISYGDLILSITEEIHKKLDVELADITRENILEEQRLLHEPSGMVMREELERVFKKLFYKTKHISDIPLHKAALMDEVYSEYRFQYGLFNLNVCYGPHIEAQSYRRDVDLGVVHKMVEESIGEILMYPSMIVRIASRKRNTVVILRAYSKGSGNIDVNYITTYPYDADAQPVKEYELLIEMED